MVQEVSLLLGDAVVHRLYGHHQITEQVKLDLHNILLVHETNFGLEQELPAVDIEVAELQIQRFQSLLPQKLLDLIVSFLHHVRNEFHRQLQILEIWMLQRSVFDELAEQQRVLTQPLHRLDQVAAQLELHHTSLEKLIQVRVELTVADLEQLEYAVALAVLQAELVIGLFQLGRELHDARTYPALQRIVVGGDGLELSQELFVQDQQLR